jgi:hypothetical protein
MEETFNLQKKKHFGNNGKTIETKTDQHQTVKWFFEDLDYDTDYRLHIRYLSRNYYRYVTTVYGENIV